MRCKGQINAESTVRLGLRQAYLTCEIILQVHGRHGHNLVKDHKFQNVHLNSSKKQKDASTLFKLLLYEMFAALSCSLFGLGK